MEESWLITTATATATATSTSTYTSTYTAPSSNDVDGDGSSGGFPTDLDDFDTLTKYDNVRVDTVEVIVDVEGGVPAVEVYNTYEDIVVEIEEIVEVSVPVQVETTVEQTSIVTSTATRLK